MTLSTAIYMHIHTYTYIHTNVCIPEKTKSQPRGLHAFAVPHMYIHTYIHTYRHAYIPAKTKSQPRGLHAFAEPHKTSSSPHFPRAESHTHLRSAR